MKREFLVKYNIPKLGVLGCNIAVEVIVIWQTINEHI